MFHHYSDVLDNKLQLAIGIVGIVSGLCFHLLPRLPKIISLANHKTNPTVTELDTAQFYYGITFFCYLMPVFYAHRSRDPLFLAFNLTGLVISGAYACITNSLPEDKLVRDASRSNILRLYFVVMCAALVSGFATKLSQGVLGTIAFVVVCAVKLGFETKDDVGPVSLLVSSWLIMMLNGAIWVAYGVLVKNTLICVSSGIGCGAGVAGLVVLCVNKNRNNNNTVAPVVDNGDGIV